jgi:uncharacterized membrane protein
MIHLLISIHLHIFTYPVLLRLFLAICFLYSILGILMLSMIMLELMKNDLIRKELCIYKLRILFACLFEVHDAGLRHSF